MSSDKDYTSQIEGLIGGTLDTFVVCAGAGNIVAQKTVAQVKTLLGLSGTNSGDQDLSALAPKTSPALTGTPTAPTATSGTNTTQIATTAFVVTAVSSVDVSGKVSKTGDSMTGALTVAKPTNTGAATVTVSGSGTGTTKINDNGTVVIDSDATTGTIILACKYNGGSSVFQVGASGNVAVPGLLQLGSGWGGAQAASGASNFKFSAFRYLSLVPESPDLGGAGGSTYWAEVNNGTIGSLRDLKVRNLITSGGVSCGAVTYAVLNATTATVGIGEYRVTDRANRRAYPDGTNWRWVADDVIIS